MTSDGHSEEVERTLEKLADRHGPVRLVCYGDPDGVIGKWVLEVAGEDVIAGESVDDVLSTASERHLNAGADDGESNE